ncbi:hypothetical protein L917_21698 [Phytophthora nicotianae]|uniref:Uncharacterized protein n=1 Tax=Phytophthora nicotianae TaxID=4792 RepID=W2JWP9_PHYNI|nr:hypothetical protein L917_21698 [Phytophthora nicotianae]
MLAPKSQPPKQTRSFVDGGVLMTRPETKAAVLEAEVQRRQKLEERAAKAQERLEKKEMRQLAAILKQFEKTRKQQEKANRSSTKISTSTRPGSRKGIKNKGSKTMEAPLIPHSNLAQDYTMPVALYLGKETDCLVPPAFTGL